MAVVDQRSRILDAALGLMAARGAAGMSMRSLAAACDLNVATLYHYFPSKQDLLRSALARGRYDALLERTVPPPVGPPAARLADFLAGLATEMLDDGEQWRVLLAEVLHGDPDVVEPVLGMSAAFESALAGWLQELLPDAPVLAAPDVVHALRHALYGVLLEYLPQPGSDAAAVARVRELAGVFARLATSDDRAPDVPVPTARGANQ